MPYSINNPPPWIKNQPRGVQRACIKGFNGAERDGASDDEARMACWAQVKLSYKKQGDKWVPKEQNKEKNMDNQVLTETHFTDVVLTEQDKDDRGYHTARLLISRGDYVNQNNRVYPMSVWEREVPNAQDKITTGSFVGMADHPSFFQGPRLLSTVVKFESLSIEGREVWGDVIFIPTSSGRDVIEIAKAGVRIGVSTRGNGSGKVAEEYVDFEGVSHKDVMVVQDDYQWIAADLVVEGSVEGAGVYHFEHLGQDDIDQLQELLFSNIEEVVSTPLNARIQELEEQLQSQDEAYNLLQIERDQGADLLLDLNDQLGAAEKEANELDARLTEETVNKASFQEHLAIRTEERDEFALAVKANAHLLERIKGEQFAMLLIEELKGCTTVAEVDEKWDAAKETVEALALNTPGPDGKAVINDTDPPDPGIQENDSAVHRLQEVMGGFTAP